MFINGWNTDILPKYKPNVFDSCATDAPYGLGKEPDTEEMLRAWLDHGYLEVKGSGFMGKKWDAFVPQPNFWKEIYRVLKPGAFVLCFFGTRTYDWGVMAMRLAGFEIRDQFAWIYGEGMPKGLDVGKQVVEFTGYNTAIKPAFEPIVLARKPISEKTIVDNMIKWGTGAYNIGESRIGNQKRFNAAGDTKGTMILAENKTGYTGQNVVGRYPANVLLGHHELCEFVGIKDSYEEVYKCHQNCPVRIIDEQSGILTSGSIMPHYNNGSEGLKSNQGILGVRKSISENIKGDSGGASRFFYCAKPSVDEREVGVKMMEKKISPNNISGGSEIRLDGKAVAKRANNHPTVKPISLMRYLIKLITPKGGKIIEPFGGSGTTHIAAQLEHFYCDSIEQDEYYHNMGKTRSEAYKAQYNLDSFFNNK